MPIKKVGGGYKWGSQGKVYKRREDAEKQAAAAYAAGYRQSHKKGSTVNSAGNYTKPSLRKRLFEQIKAGTRGGKAGQWSARKAQLLALEYKKAGGGYKA